MQEHEEVKRMEDRPMEDRLRRALKKSLPPLAVAGGLALLELARRRFQRRRLFRPEGFPEGVGDPRDLGLAAEDEWFSTSDGVELHGWWMPKPDARGTLLFCHGHSGSLGHRVDLFRELLRLPLNLFAFDYRGYGRSAGRPSEQGLFRDVRAAYDHLTSRLGEAAERIVLFGQSLGGAVAIDGALHRPVAGLVVQSSFVDLRALARSSSSRLPLHWIASNHFRNLDKVRRIQVPKLFIHGTGDSTIPYAHGETLFEQAAQPKQLLPVIGAGHHDVHIRGGESYFRRLANFLTSCLD